MKHISKRALLALISVSVLSSTGCKTQFYGEAKVPGGRQGCQAMCQNQGMELAGMVLMGEYSDGCVCQVPGRVAGTEGGEQEQQSRLVYVGAAGAAAAAAGVAIQTDDDEQAARNQQANP